MILNISKIKTEALLLFCKDIILTYQDADEFSFDVNEETHHYINSMTHDILQQLENLTKSHEYYLTNRDNSRIKAILLSYEHINKSLSKELKDGKPFNPSMLYFSMLATWFAELQKESRSKEYIYFIIYPYANVYDKLLINIKDKEFKALNVSMINIAEKIIWELEQYKFV
ncbi:hypothetical protein [Candidatus Marinarcus aquaticus]|uniref:Uncharacterized protein n=1 Tax=Candidatus Marinarcus aquaticus TaxID=2044504 RepID=A0A4Q0XQM1_9BACT|nr:hypothetical protein [Candidatus Marinarcus aquaticus]RXJ57888.1 hypothetical protein CRV04_05115 [Candidatus Marinarcus aquaticus]